MEKFHRIVEIASNLAIIAVAITLGIFMLGRFFDQSTAAPGPTQAESVQPGATLPLKDVDWSQSERNLVMVLSTSCRYCTDSLPFYGRLAKQNAENDKLRIIASFPQDVTEARKYLEGIGIGIDDVIKANPAEALARGTPTLILTDNKGVVLETWVGKLPPEKEAEVLRAFLK